MEGFEGEEEEESELNWTPVQLLEEGGGGDQRLEFWRQYGQWNSGPDAVYYGFCSGDQKGATQV